ncbi:MAG: hypothetical protein WDN66_02420 [Candidatus Saccharibacteria bacterium]
MGHVAPLSTKTFPLARRAFCRLFAAPARPRNVLRAAAIERKDSLSEEESIDVKKLIVGVVASKLAMTALLMLDRIVLLSLFS